MASAAAGPSTWATATVRFSATTGVGENTVSWPYSATIWCQLVRGIRRVGVHRVDRGLDLVRARPVAPQAPPDDGLAPGR